MCIRIANLRSNSCCGFMSDELLRYIASQQHLTNTNYQDIEANASAEVGVANLSG